MTRVYIEQCRLSNGLVVRSDSRSPLEALYREVFENCVYTPPGFEIKPKDVVVDLGANIGVFSLFAASVSSTVHVHAIEPSSRSFALLQTKSNRHSSAAFSPSNWNMARPEFQIRKSPRNTFVPQSGLYRVGSSTTKIFQPPQSSYCCRSCVEEARHACERFLFDAPSNSAWRSGCRRNGERTLRRNQAVLRERNTRTRR
jgi:hypothetical protein